jgi:saccharopine dehydrogenase-like NADP-dependent oxidoreductase
MVMPSYVDESMSKLRQAAKGAGVTILCEMGLDHGLHVLDIMVDHVHFDITCIVHMFMEVLAKGLILN